MRIEFVAASERFFETLTVQSPSMMTISGTGSMTGDFKNVDRYTALLRLEVLSKVTREMQQGQPRKPSLFNDLKTADGRPIFSLPDVAEAQS
jgi:hypothetical protein